MGAAHRQLLRLTLLHDGLVLPDGFEATVFAEGVGSARHLAVNNNGDVYVKLRYPKRSGENVALRDTTNDGRLI